MTSLPIHINTHHFNLTDPLREFVRKKIAPVTRFAHDALAADVVLCRHGGATTRFSATAHLSLPGRDIHGSAVHADPYVAIGKLVAKLARLLRKRKTRLAKIFKRPARREIPQLRVAPHIQKASSDVLDIPLTSRVREGGQEMRVFGFRRRDPLAIINQRT